MALPCGHADSRQCDDTCAPCALHHHASCITCFPPRSGREVLELELRSKLDEAAQVLREIAGSFERGATSEHNLQTMALRYARAHDRYAKALGLHTEEG